MCLDYVDNFEPCEVGYKTVVIHKGKIFSLMFGHNKPLRRGVWLNEEDYRVPPKRSFIKTSYSKEYPCGFHLFHSRTDALDFRMNTTTEHVVKVKVKFPVAVGTQSGTKVTVAKFIRILPDNT